MSFIFALLCVSLGLTLVFGGYRLARFIIPLWGFLTGLAFGGAIASDMSSTPFLGAAVGIAVGLLAGLLLALFAYLYYVAAVIILFGSFGYWLGSAFIMLFGFDYGLLSVMIGMILGTVAGFFAFVINAPKYVLVVITTLGGAITTIGGLLLMTDQISLDTLSYSAVHGIIENSAWWTVLGLGLAVTGMVVQTATASRYRLQEWTVGAEEPATQENLPPVNTGK